MIQVSRDPRISLDVSVASPPLGSGRSDLVPTWKLVRNSSNNSKQQYLTPSSVRAATFLDITDTWMCKDMVLKQDFFAADALYGRQIGRWRSCMLP
jgi:hypothetical protein